MTTLPLYLQLEAVLHGPKVRRKLDDVADRVAGIAKEVGGTDISQEVGRDDGTRPKGRPYARVFALETEEFGAYRVLRRRALGQAVDRVNKTGPSL